jgi:hypothetical protein
VLQWCYNGATGVVQRRYNSLKIVFTIVSQLCHNDVTMVLQRCYNRVTMVSPGATGGRA